MEKTSEHMEEFIIKREFRRNMAMRIFAGLGVVFLILLVVGAFSMHSLRYRNDMIFQSQSVMGEAGTLRVGGPATRIEGGMGMNSYMRKGYSATSNLQVLSGVVTAVTDTNFTLAGGGVSNVIQTNSTTQYLNNQKPAINDSVQVEGTTSNGALTATQVIVE